MWVVTQHQRFEEAVAHSSTHAGTGRVADQVDRLIAVIAQREQVLT